MDLLSIAEAARLTGRHEKTIRRWVKKQLDSDPQAEEKIVQEAIASGFSYRIDKDYLLTHSPTPLGSPPIQGGVQSPGQDTEQDTRQHLYPPIPLIVAKDETITLLKEQVRQQQEELNKKNEQLKMVLERVGEQNILLKGYQQRYLLEDPREYKRMDSLGDKAPSQATDQYSVNSTVQGRQANSKVMDTNHKQNVTTENQKEAKPVYKQPQKSKSKKPEQPNKKSFFSFLRGK